MSTKRRIPTLDGLRAVSVVAVLLTHALPTMPPDSVFRVIQRFYPDAHLGVQVFFVISGFIITHLLTGEWEESGTISRSQFYARRVRRIFPAFYAYVAVVAALMAAHVINVPFSQLVSAATFTWNYKTLWDTSPATWFLGHFWTLSIEEQFYILWPSLLLWAGLRRARGIALVGVAAMPVIRVLSYVFFPSTRGQLGMMFHCASDSIMAGCWLALAWQEPWFRKALDRFASWIGPALGVAYLVILDPYLIERFRGAYSITVGMTIETILITWIISWLLAHPQSRAAKILNTAPLVHLGTISYGLYLWQQLFLMPQNRSWSGSFPLNLLCCVVVAEISYWCVERPFLRRSSSPAISPSKNVETVSPISW